jgi:hypothetical protein
MIAIDIDMPENCLACKFEGCKDGWSVCKLKEDIDTNQHDRPAACPLREVKTIEIKHKLPAELMSESSDEESRYFTKEIADALCEEKLADFTYNKGEVIERYTIDGTTQEKILGRTIIVTGRVMVIAPPPRKEA